MPVLASRRLAVLLAVLISLAGFAIAARPAAAAEVNVAVASNFRIAAERIAAAFEAETGHRVRLSFGSTGQLYAQIRHGAPFDVFLAADRERPRRLAAEGIAVAPSRFTYARGRLVLWSPRPGYVDGGGAVLREGDYARLAIANPRLAPYGEAARQTLIALGLWEKIDDRLIRAQSIAQAHQFVASGSVPLGFLALSQVRLGETGSRWLVPEALHDPIEQQAVLIDDTRAARAFLAFLRGAESRRIIERHGYVVPAVGDPPR